LRANARWQDWTVAVGLVLLPFAAKAQDEAYIWNYERLFDGARRDVRAWEKAHVKW